MKDIRHITEEELEKFIKNIGEKPFRTKQIKEWLWKKGSHSFDEMANLSLSLRQKLTDTFTFHQLSIAKNVKSSDGTEKMLFRLSDSHLVEGVLIPTSNRVTACISSQVGCPLQCRFCATGQGGYVRNLHFSEIYDQFLLMNQQSLLSFQKGISNIVFMGMGEPLLNYENVKQTILLLTSPHGQGWSPTRITLSTVGIVDKIQQLAEDLPNVGLAISLHTADPQKRLQLMPVTATNSLPKLQEALVNYVRKTNHRVSIEYLLLGNLTDSLQDADQLLRFCKPFPVKINLIQYNATDSIFLKSTLEKTETFANYLISKNLIVTIRQSRGEDIAAACGQLATQNFRILFN